MLMMLMEMNWATAHFLFGEADFLPAEEWEVYFPKQFSVDPANQVNLEDASVRKELERLSGEMQVDPSARQE